MVAVHKWLHVEDCKLYNRRWFEVTVQTNAESDYPRQTYINIDTNRHWLSKAMLNHSDTAAGLDYAHTHTGIHQ